jgi:hypothetical protein
MLDRTDEAIALAVLKCLGDMSLREMARATPFSRGTLHRWQSGDYDMWPRTRRTAIAWLRDRGVEVAPATPPTEGAAIDEVELANLGKRATEPPAGTGTGGHGEP